LIGVKIAPKYQHFCSSGARNKADVTKCGYDLEFRKLYLRSTKRYINHIDCMHQSGNKACQSWPIIAEFCNFKQQYSLNQVTTNLAVPARILRIYFSTKPKPTQWVW
jgi:hypothetical protein